MNHSLLDVFIKARQGKLKIKLSLSKLSHNKQQSKVSHNKSESDLWQGKRLSTYSGSSFRKRESMQDKQSIMAAQYYHDAYQIFELLDKSYNMPPDPAAMMELFQRKPYEATKTFAYGQTLLHKSFEFFSSHERVIDVLLGAYPEALKKEDDDGYLPIHRLLLGRWGDNIPEMVSKIVNAFPECLVTPTLTGGELPLHIASKRTDRADVIELLLCFPDACQYRDYNGKFPLDHALEASIPRPSIVRLLVNHHPVLLSFPDEKGFLKIHKILNKCSLLEKSCYDEVVETLVSGCEACLRVQDASGCTPLFLACTQNHSLSQIYSLVRTWPEQVTHHGSKTIFDSTTFNGEILYPSLVSRSTKMSNVQSWLHRDAEARYRADIHGRLPIHYAVLSESRGAYEIVRCLLFGMDDDNNDESSCQNQLSTRDKNGRLPIHLASALPSCRAEILNLLIEKHPESLLQADEDGRLPWHYGECSRQDLVFETTAELFPGIEVDLDLVPEEIQWDILSVKGHDTSSSN